MDTSKTLYMQQCDYQLESEINESSNWFKWEPEPHPRVNRTYPHLLNHRYLELGFHFILSTKVHLRVLKLQPGQDFT